MDDLTHDAWTLAAPSEVDGLVEPNRRRVLFIGTDGYTVEGRERRVSADLPGLLVPVGTWAFRQGSEWNIVVSRSGLASAAVGTDQSQIAPDTPIWRALVSFGALWEAATELDSVGGPMFAPGDAVLLRGGSEEVGFVHGTSQPTVGTWRYSVVIGGVSQLALERDLIRVELNNDVDRWLEPPSATCERLAQLVTLTKLSTSLSDIVYSYGATRTVFRPYQFKPLLKLLESSSQRMLIADEVGLGKTIEAGLIWAEIDQRSPIRRGLVVCPSSLTRKWQSEMLRRFDRDLEILDNRRLVELVGQMSEGRDPKFQAIVSLETLRMSPALDQLAQHSPRLDIVIVDEAHALRNVGTRSFALGELLSDWADVMLFLSATPLNLGRDDLFNLLNLLSTDDFPDRRVFDEQIGPNGALNTALVDLRFGHHPPVAVRTALSQGLQKSPAGQLVTKRPEFDRLVQLLVGDALTTADKSEAIRLILRLNTLSNLVTRTRKVDVPDAKATRVAVPIDVAWTAREYALYVAIREWARARAMAQSGVVGFATIMPLRQAASCLPAMRQLLEERLGGFGLEDDDFDELDGEMVETSDDVLDVSELESALRKALRELGDLDTKYDRFREALDGLQASGLRQVMVFSFFRGTLRYLHRRLSPDVRARIMDGSITSMDERARIMEDFRAGKFDVLLVSEVGSEGLDFEFCGALINYDLPWNPMRVEQRIGRLDRFGQQHEKIHIFNFHVPGTIETDIFERLYARIRIFEESLGELEPIIRNEFNEVTKLAIDPKWSDAEREREVARREVALENHRAELAALQEASTSLAVGVDQVFVEGLEDALVLNGRYVGASEIESLVRAFVEPLGGRLKAPAKNQRIHEVVGCPEVVKAAQAALMESSSVLPDSWVAALRDGAPMLVTFDSTTATTSACEFLTLSHPIVRAATTHLQRNHHYQERHGVVSFEEAPSGRFLVLLAVVDVNGLRPVAEFRHPTIDLVTGERRDEVGRQLLAAHAQGRLVAASPTADDRTAVVRRLQDMLETDRSELHERERRANDALIDGRALALRRTIESKIRRAEDTLATLRSRNAGENIQRLHLGRIARLKTDLDVELDRLEEHREFAVTTRPLVLVEVVGAS